MIKIVSLNNMAKLQHQVFSSKMIPMMDHKRSERVIRGEMRRH